MSSMPKLANFLDLHAAELVDALEPSTDLLLAHLLRISHQQQTDELAAHFRVYASSREMITALLAQLAKEQRPGRLLMAFLCALLHCGHLALFSRLLGLQLVDSHSFERFARANDPTPFPSSNALQFPPPCEEADSSVLICCPVLEQQRQFAERHAEVLRLKLVQVPTMLALLVSWQGQTEDWPTEVESMANGCERLIQSLIDRNHQWSSRAFDCFCLALLVTRQFRLFSIFHELADSEWLQRSWQQILGAEKCGHERHEESEEEDEEGEEWKDEMPKGVLSGLRVETVDSGPGAGSQLLAYYAAHKEQIYPNFTEPRGLALIINNFTFVNRQHREGSQVDEQNLTNLFRQLSYRVHIENDLRADQILTAIRRFAGRPEHAGAHSAVVVLLSHGEFNAILGTDDQLVNFHELQASLNAQNAPKLAGKPKIIIVQACRGTEFDLGVNRPLMEDESPDGPFSFLFSSKPSRKGPLNVSSVFRGPPPSSPSGSSTRRQSQQMGANMVKEPSWADMLTAFSTTPNFVSWRNSATGTWFVQALCEVFSRWAKEEDILTMLTRVKKQVAKREAQPKGYKQVPQTSSTLRKRFFFFPGVKQSQV